MNAHPADRIPPPPSALTAFRLERASARVAAIWQGKWPAAIDPAHSANADTDVTSRSTDWLRPKPAKTCRKHDRRLVSRTKALSSLWPFSELPRSVLLKLSALMREVRFVAGRRIIRQGGRSRHLWVVWEGSVEVRVRDCSRQRIVAELPSGSILGEMGILTGAPSTATVTATTPVRAAMISARRFRRLAARFPVLNSSLGYLIGSRLGQAPEDSLTGKILHGYRLDRCLGRGSMGIVYEAEQLAAGRRVALKMLNHRFALDLDVQQRFDREIRICRSLRHPCIARILDHFSAFGTHFMVMELCEGIALDQFLRLHGPLPEDQVRRITGQLAAALSYLHCRGICHRDVKPGNIIITEEQGIVKLTDFGLAKSPVSSELTHQQYVLGTPGYMPPEQFTGEPIDCRADLFALGCVVYEMLTGDPLFADGNMASILSRELHWTLPPADQIRPGLSEDLYQVLRQTIAADPRDRILSLERLSRIWG